MSIATSERELIMPIQRASVVAGDRGIALVTTMLVMMLMMALMVGFSAAIMGDQRSRSIEKDRIRAFYAAQSGLEKLSADLAAAFLANVAPTAATLTTLSAEDQEPSIPGVTFTLQGDDAGAYAITKTGTDNWDHIESGPYEGLIALTSTYELDSAVRTTAGGEAHLKRAVDTVAIPVFQFGIFSDVDLSFHAGANFNFGGRIHSNANLYLAQGGGAGTTLTLPQKVTAVGEVVRKFLVNGRAIGVTDHIREVRVATAPGATRALLTSEGSVVDSVGSALNDPTWTNTSLTTYHGYIRNGRTGAKTLKLPVVTLAGQPIDIIKRPPTSGVDALLAERMYGKVSLRILLSDTSLDLTSLPGATAGAPVALEGNWKTAPPAGYTVDATHTPLARSAGAADATTSEAISAGEAEIDITGGTPDPYRPAGGGANNLTLTSMLGGMPIASAPITCTGRRTDNLIFTGCSGLIPALAGSTVTATVDSVTVTATTTADLLGTEDEIPVDTLANFGRETYWFGSTLVTCTGNDTVRLRGCTGTVASGNGTTVSTSALTPAGTGTIGGFIKIEMQQQADNVWRDVTMEILNHGFAGPNLDTTVGRACGDPTPNAIIRIQRLRENREAGAGACNYAASQRSIDYWPNVLYDTREGQYRTTTPAGNPLRLGGVMHYVTIDVRNLSDWFEGQGVYAGQSGTAALSDGGYSVYFSDRRNNRNASNQETGEYGFEDVINSVTAGGVPNAAFETGEDVNANGSTDVYGGLPSYNGVANSVIAGSVAPLDVSATPSTTLTSGQARVNRGILFRRALKLTNGGLGNIVAPGLTIVSENPVYIQGDWNFDAATAANPTAAPSATAFIADAVTVLSNNWSDSNSLTSPYTTANRARTANSYYRFAVIAGQNKPFARANVLDGVDDMQDFGTDGGAHNFLRMLEAGGGAVNYRGSIATFYYSRQAVGVYKTTTVYGAPTRNFNFDTDFLDPSKLPPLTPRFSDINARGFRQEIRPGR